MQKKLCNYKYFVPTFSDLSKKIKQFTVEEKLCHLQEIGCNSPVESENFAGSERNNRDSERFSFITKTNWNSFTGQGYFDVGCNTCLEQSHNNIILISDTVHFSSVWCNTCSEQSHNNILLISDRVHFSSFGCNTCLEQSHNNILLISDTVHFSSVGTFLFGIK